MKIVLDIDKLLVAGEITPQEYDRLKMLAIRETGSLAFNIFYGFGVIATAGGALALQPSPLTAIVTGVLLAGSGVLLTATLAKEWGLLGVILLLVGSFAAAGGIIALTDGGVVGFLIVTILCIVAAILAKSALLAAMAALSLSATVGSMTAYGHATYVLGHSATNGHGRVVQHSDLGHIPFEQTVDAGLRAYCDCVFTNVTVLGKRWLLGRIAVGRFNATEYWLTHRCPRSCGSRGFLKAMLFAATR